MANPKLDRLLNAEQQGNITARGQAVLDAARQRGLLGDQGPGPLPDPSSFAEPIPLPDPRIAQAAADPFSPAAMQRDAGQIPDVPSQARDIDDLPSRLSPDRIAGLFGTGANIGIADIIGLPVYAANNAPRLINLLPGEQGATAITESPIGGIESVRAGLRALVGETAPETAGERIIQRIGREVGATVVPGGAIGKRARTLESATTAAGRQAKTPIGQTIDDTIIRQFRDAPGATAATELGLSTAAGTGAGLANEGLARSIGIEPGAFSDVLGALVGSLGAGGAFSALRGGTNMIREGASVAKQAVAPNPLGGRRLRLEVGRTLKENSSDPATLPERIGEGQSVTRDVEGFQPTTATAAADPGLQSLEGLQRKRSAPAEFDQVDTRNNQAVTQALEDEAPRVADDAATRANLEGQKARTEGRVEKLTQGRTAQLEAARSEVEPSQRLEDAGRAVREGVEAEQTSLKQTRTEASDPALQDSLGRNGVDTSKTRNLIEEKRATVKDRKLQTALKDIDDDLHKNRVNKAGERELETTTDQVYAVRKEINARIAQRGDDALSKRAQAELIEVRNSLDGDISKVAPRFKEFLTEFTEGSVPVNLLDEGATGKVLKKTKFTETPTIPDSAVPAEFLKRSGPKSGAPEAIEEFVKKVGGRPQAVEGLRQAALVDAKAAFEKGGEKGLRKWIKDHEDALSSFPEVTRDLGTVADAQKALSRAERLRKLQEKGPGTPREKVIATYLDAGTGREAMAVIFKRSSSQAKQDMKRLMRLLKGDADAIEGAQRAFWDHAFQAEKSGPTGVLRNKGTDLQGTPFLNPGAAKEFMQKHKGTLDVLYQGNPDHLKRVNKIIDAVERGTNVGTTPGKTTPGAAGKSLSVPGLTVTGFAARSFAVARGVVSVEFVVGETLLRAGRALFKKVRKDQFDALLNRALLDPEVAKTLAMNFNQSTQGVVRRRMRLHLAEEASAITTGRDEEE